MDGGVAQVALHQVVDVAVEGGGEQHPLPLGTHLVQDLGDLRQEAHVTHLVGLVQDRDAHASQSAVLALDEVVQPAGRGDDDLGAVPQRGGLPSDGHAAHHGREPQPQGLGVGGECLTDLLRQLPGGHENERQRLLGLRTPPARPGEHPQAEGERLAGSGAAPAQDVSSRERVRQRRRLDGKGHGHTVLVQRPQNPGRQPQLCEGRRRGRRRVLRAGIATY